MGTAYELPIHPDQAAAASGEQRFYYLDPPMEPDVYDTEDMELVSFVVVSAANVPYTGAETYIFRADPWGRVASYGELPGSFQGGWDHEAALIRAGYDMAPGDLSDGARAALTAARNAATVIEAGAEQKEIEA